MVKCNIINTNDVAKEKMKFKLKSGKVKEFDKMNKKEKQEVDKSFMKGLLGFGLIYGGISLIDKL